MPAWPRRALKAQPECRSAIFAVAALAWLMLFLGGDLLSALPLLCTGSVIAALPGTAEIAYVFLWISPSELAASWGVMLAAMMLPLVVGPVGYVRARSLRRHQAAATLGFLAGYLAIWMAAGLPIVAFALFLRLAADAPEAGFVFAMCLAIGWQATPWKQIALNRCHSRPPSPGIGTGALRSWVLFGGNHSLWCVASCGPVMLALLLVPPPSQLGMALGAFWIWVERLESPQSPAVGFKFPRRVFRALRHRVADRSIAGITPVD